MKSLISELFAFQEKKTKNLYEKALLMVIDTGKKLNVVSMNHISIDGSYFKGNVAVNQLFTGKDIKIVEEIIQVKKVSKKIFNGDTKVLDKVQKVKKKSDENW
ncbi:MAG: hypothetical protein LBB45_03950 [Methanobrevibacter sp.]|jgi:metallophosphoesterase superfamily enzyme|nr:hypothetical protein [Candidatus Methanovirga basalitermitum]